MLKMKGMLQNKEKGIWMIHLVLFLCMVAVPSLAGTDADRDEQMANKEVIVSPDPLAVTEPETGTTVVLNAVEPRNDAGPLWTDPDIVIDSAVDFQDISVATRRSNGVIYAAYSYCSNAGEIYKLRVMQSPDGMNWSQYLIMSASTSNLLYPSLNIFTTADSEYLILAYGQQDTAAGECNVRSYCRAFGAASGVFRDISAYNGLYEMDPSICSSDPQFPNNPWLYCAFESGDSIGFVRSTDYGRTWTSRQIIGNGSGSYNYSDPDCAFGWFSSPDSFFIGVAWAYTSNLGARHIRFRKNTINGAPGYWRGINYFTSPANSFDYYPALEMTHGTYPSAVISFVRIDTAGTDNADVYRFITNDGADTWDTLVNYNSGSAINKPNGLAVDDYLGDYHLVFRNQSGTMVYGRARYDSTAYSWQSSYFGNSSTYSPYDFPAVGARNGQAYVCWADLGSSLYLLKFDAEWLETGVEEVRNDRKALTGVILAPNPSKGEFSICYNIKKEGLVRVAMFDISGRLVKNIASVSQKKGDHSLPVHVSGLAAGVYFVRLETAAGIQTKEVTILRGN